MYGNATETACLPIPGADLKEQLAQAITHIAQPDRELLHMDAPDTEEGKGTETIPATEVPALALNAVFGRRTAPKRSAFFASSSRALLPILSMVPLLISVELDSLTGRIARQLYQKADIAISGFEDTDHPDDFFDLAIGNVPFGE